MSGTQSRKRRAFQNFRVAVPLAFWAALIAVCFVFRDKITVDTIVCYAPEQALPAVLVLLMLYALKSVSIVIYSGILNIAGGIMFPLSLALPVNILGTAIIVAIPFVMGRKMGSGALERLIQRHPKLHILTEFPQKNAFLTSLFIRLLGVLPSDLVGIYLGASGIGFKEYLLGSVLGMLPSVCAFTVMGSSIHAPGSIQFIISLVCELCCGVLSVLLFFLLKRKKSSELM